MGFELHGIRSVENPESPCNDANSYRLDPSLAFSDLRPSQSVLVPWLFSYHTAAAA
jgi:hypothetical protein